MPVVSLFSETIMFLHEIFHQGLKARIANWPTLVLGEHCRHSLVSSSTWQVLAIYSRDARLRI